MVEPRAGPASPARGSGGDGPRVPPATAARWLDHPTRPHAAASCAPRCGIGIGIGDRGWPRSWHPRRFTSAPWSTSVGIGGPAQGEWGGRAARGAGESGAGLGWLWIARRARHRGALARPPHSPARRGVVRAALRHRHRRPGVASIVASAPLHVRATVNERRNRRPRARRVGWSSRARGRRVRRGAGVGHGPRRAPAAGLGWPRTARRARRGLGPTDRASAPLAPLSPMPPTRRAPSRPVATP